MGAAWDTYPEKQRWGERDWLLSCPMTSPHHGLPCPQPSAAACGSLNSGSGATTEDSSGGLGAHQPGSLKVWPHGKQGPPPPPPASPSAPQSESPILAAHASWQSQFEICLFHSWASNGIKTRLFIFTDGADFCGTSATPDVVRTGTQGNSADRNPRANPSPSPTPPRASRDPDQEKRRKAAAGPATDPGGEASPAPLAGGENRVSSLPRVPSETTRGTERRAFHLQLFSAKGKSRW